MQNGGFYMKFTFSGYYILYVLGIGCIHSYLYSAPWAQYAQPYKASKNIFAGIAPAFSMNSMSSPWHQQSHTLLHRNATHTFRTNPIHIQKLKGSFDRFEKKHQPDSPLIGAACMDGKLLSNIYRYGPPHAATTKLVNDSRYGIFHFGHILAPTQNKSNPAYGLTPALITSVVHALKTNTIHQESIQQELATALRNSFRTKINSKFSQTKAMEFIQLIAQASTEKIFIPGTTSAILTALLYRIAHTQEDIEQYIQKINIPINTIDVIDNKQGTNQTEARHRIGELYEKTVIQTIVDQEGSVGCPPNVRAGSYGFQGQPCVPDCMETALRTICNWIVASDKELEFDLNTLPETVTVHPDIKTFYTTFNQFSTVNIPEAGQAWMNLMSGIKGIIYVHNNYEMEPLEENIVPLFNHLFGIQAHTIAQIGDLLSNNARSIIFRKNVEKNIEISITNITTQTSYVLTLYIEPRAHAYVVTPKQNISTIEPKEHQYITELFQRSDHSDDIKQLAGSLLSVIGANETQQNLCPDTATYMHHILTQDLSTPEKKAEAIKIIFKDPSKLKNHPECYPIIMSLVESLPRDWYFPSIFIELIITHKLFENTDVFDTYIYKDIDHIITQLAHTCAHVISPTSSPFFTNAILFLKQKKLYTELLGALIEGVSENNYNLKELFPFMQYAIEHIKTVLPQHMHKKIEQLIKKIQTHWHCYPEDIEKQKPTIISLILLFPHTASLSEDIIQFMIMYKLYNTSALDFCFQHHVDIIQKNLFYGTHKTVTRAHKALYDNSIEYFRQKKLHTDLLSGLMHYVSHNRHAFRHMFPMIADALKHGGMLKTSDEQAIIDCVQQAQQEWLIDPTYMQQYRQTIISLMSSVKTNALFIPQNSPFFIALKIFNASAAFSQHALNHIDTIKKTIADICGTNTICNNYALFINSIEYLEQKGLYSDILDALLQSSAHNNYSFKDTVPFIMQILKKGGTLPAHKSLPLIPFLEKALAHWQTYPADMAQQAAELISLISSTDTQHNTCAPQIVHAILKATISTKSSVLQNYLKHHIAVITDTISGLCHTTLLAEQYALFVQSIRYLQQEGRHTALLSALLKNSDSPHYPVTALLPFIQEAIHQKATVPADLLANAHMVIKKATEHWHKNPDDKAAQEPTVNALAALTSEHIAHANTQADKSYITKIWRLLCTCVPLWREK